jgi:hypothetical protein
MGKDRKPRQIMEAEPERKVRGEPMKIYMDSIEEIAEMGRD